MKMRLMLPALFLAGAALPALAQDMPMPSPETAPPADPNANMPAGAVPPGAGQMVPADPSVPHDPAAPKGTAANPAVVGGNMTAPPPAPKDYPVCSKTVTDSCMNPADARKMKHARHH